MKGGVTLADATKATTTFVMGDQDVEVTATYKDAGGTVDFMLGDVDADGKAYPKSEQVARCGNAVCPPIPTALVRANLPELCPERRSA